MTIAVLNSNQADFESRISVLLARDSGSQQEVETAVREIIQRVRGEGDQALIDYTECFDGLKIGESQQLELPVEQCHAALKTLDVEQRAALEFAAQRIEDFHRHQLQESWSYAEPDGTRLGQIVTAIDKIGLYVPGGKAAYPSSVLMNAIPARIAGVRQLTMVVPTPDGEVNQMVLAAAALAGVDQVFRVGGAQAIAALAYGTDTIPAVDKIVGPGNIYVATAKRQVFGEVGIDMIAGPSEVVVVADSSVAPEWIAMDLFAQAEHDELAQSILIAWDGEVIDAVKKAIDQLLPEMERSEIIDKALTDHGALIEVGDFDQAIELVNRIAPEHLELLFDAADAHYGRFKHAGAIFVGPYSAEVLGDYCAGPNHVLPTSGTARFSSPLGVYDFQKRSSLIQCSASGGDVLGRMASVLARGESLTAHARSAEYRIKGTSINR